ncbi:hypothetical protein Tco_1266040 [Tanacetum coccineum]
MEEVSLVDGVFDGAFGGDRDEDVVIGEGVEMALEEEAWAEAMKIENEEDEDDGKSGEAFGRHLEEIHVTGAQFWKKPDKIIDWYKEGLKIELQKVETA